MESKDTKGVLFILLASVVIILGIGVILSLSTITSPVYGYTNLSDNNTANLSASCTQNVTRYFNISDSQATLGDASVSDICFYNTSNVTLALYYDNIYKDNFTLNCSNSSEIIETLPIFQVNVTDGEHTITYATNLCYDNPDTNTTLYVKTLAGRQYLTYANSVTNTSFFGTLYQFIFGIVALVFGLIILKIIADQFE